VRAEEPGSGDSAESLLARALSALEHSDAAAAAGLLRAVDQLFAAGTPGLAGEELQRTLELHARCLAQAARLQAGLGEALQAISQSRRARAAYGR